MRSKGTSWIWTILLVIVFIGMLLIPSIINLGKKNTKEFKLVGAVEAVDYTKQYAFIPVAKSTYYVGILADESIVIFRSNKNWYEKNFSSIGLPNSGRYVTLEGKVEVMPSKVSTEMRTVIASLKSGGYTDFVLDSNKCIDGLTKNFAMKGIVASLISIVLCVVFVVGTKKGWMQKSAVVTALSICALATVIFGVHIILGR